MKIGSDRHKSQHNGYFQGGRGLRLGYTHRQEFRGTWQSVLFLNQNDGYNISKDSPSYSFVLLTVLIAMFYNTIIKKFNSFACIYNTICRKVSKEIYQNINTRNSVYVFISSSQYVIVQKFGFICIMRWDYYLLKFIQNLSNLISRLKSII